MGATLGVRRQSRFVGEAEELRPETRGEKRLALPGEFGVLDVVTGAEYAARTREIASELTPPATRVFRLGAERAASRGA